MESSLFTDQFVLLNNQVPLSAAGANVMLFASLLKAGRVIVVSGILAQEITENTIFHDWAEKLLISVFFWQLYFLIQFFAVHLGFTNVIMWLNIKRVHRLMTKNEACQGLGVRNGFK